jgi:hypothetical protein
MTSNLASSASNFFIMLKTSTARSLLGILNASLSPSQPVDLPNVLLRYGANRLDVFSIHYYMRLTGTVRVSIENSINKGWRVCKCNYTSSHFSDHPL